MTRVACALLLVATPALADEVFLPEAAAPAAIFGAGVSAERHTLELGEAELAAISQQLGKRVEQRRYTYLLVFGSNAHAGGSGVAQGDGRGAVLGAVLFLDVVGQNLPIGFAAGLRPDGTLQDLQVTVYREPYGKEINERRFRAQFRGKSARDPLRLGKDIDAISGASISSQSAAYAARKALALSPYVFRRAP